MGGEESSTGHQLLSDYIIPDIKTTHTARVPAGGRERRAGAELGQPRPQANSYFSLGARRWPRWPRKWTPVSVQPRGGTPHQCLASRGAQGSAPRRLRGGTAAEAALRGRWAGRLRSIPRLRASPAAYLCGVALGSGAHSHGPLSALLRRGPGGSGGSAVGPRSSWASRSAEGAAPVSPARQPGPSLAGAGGGFVCARVVLGALRL